MTEPQPAPLLTPDDLKKFATIAPAKAQEMIHDAIGEAAFHAPCILDCRVRSGAKGVRQGELRGAVLRWNEAGSGAVQTQASIVLLQTIDSRHPRKGMFFQAEIDKPQKVMPQRRQGRRVVIDLFPPAAPRLSANELFERDLDTTW